jgi:hypothetical protein
VTDDTRRSSSPHGPDSSAFVVQIQRDARDDGTELRGRAEHLASGTEIRFGSAEDLLAFLRRLVAAPR